MIGFALTEEQLATLLKMVFVANTIANSPNEGSLKRKDFQEMEEYIFERAKNTFPMAVYDHKVGEDRHHHPSSIFESDPEVNSIMDLYEEYVMPFVLAEKFAEREINNEFGFNSKDNMSAEQYEEILAEKAVKYEDIIKEHGIDALIINPKYI